MKNATLIIEKASCTDTTNFTILASNTEEKNVTATVELLVNCKCFIHNKLQNQMGFCFECCTLIDTEYKIHYQQS